MGVTAVSKWHSIAAQRRSRGTVGMTNGCRGWSRTTTSAFKGRGTAVIRPGRKKFPVPSSGLITVACVNAELETRNPELQRMVEPEVVATSPCRIKSPMPVCCGFDSRLRAALRRGKPAPWIDRGLSRRSPKGEGGCSRRDLHPHWRRSRRRASALGYTSQIENRQSPIENQKTSPAGLFHRLRFLAEAARAVSRSGMKWCARPVTLRIPALVQCDAGYKPAGSL